MEPNTTGEKGTEKMRELTIEETLESILGEKGEEVIVNKAAEEEEELEKSEVALESTFILDVSSLSNEDPSRELLVEREGDESTEDPLAFVCKYCDGKFPSNVSLAKHLRREHSESLLKCKFCRRIFVDRGDLAEHQEKHRTAKRNMFKCSVCRRHFFTERLLAAHERKHEESSALFSRHANAGPRRKNSFRVRCDVCTDEFSSKLTFRRHIEERVCGARVDEMKHICAICHRIVGTVELKRHFCSPRFKCDACGRDFTTKNRLGKHLQKLHSSARLPVGPLENYCLECEVQFDGAAQYDRHNSQTGHNILRLLSCKLCKKMFTRENELLKHNERHAIYLAKCKYACRYCPAKFAQPQKLVSHYGGAHPKEKPYRCVQCDLDFQHKTKFAIHIRLEHKGAGKMKFLSDFSISFTPNAAISTEDDAECGEPLEIGAIETVETSETVVEKPKKNADDAPQRIPSLSYLREFEAMKIISKLNETKHPLVKRRVVSSAKELKLNLVKNAEVSQKVIIRKISEDEAREKKRMVINAIPYSKGDAIGRSIRGKSPEIKSTDGDARDRTDSLDEFLNFGDGNDYAAADDGDRDEAESPAPNETLLLVNSNPLESLIDKRDGKEAAAKEQPKVTPKNYVNMIINTLMASAAKQQAVMMGPEVRRRGGGKSKYQPKEFDYESIIKKSLTVDEKAVKERQERERKRKEDKAKRGEPKSKYKPKEYDYFNIISKSLKYEETRKRAPTKKKAKGKPKSGKRSKRLKTEM